MKLILHIGCEKTGTTTIQRVLSKNRDLLLQQGVVFPKLFGSPNHMEIGVACANDTASSELRLVELKRQDCTFEQYRQRLSASLQQEFSRPGIETAIISNEHLHSRLCRDEEVERLAAFIRPFADEVKVLVYLRRQDRLAVSLNSTRIRLGGNAPIFPPAGPLNLPPYFDFDAMLSRYANVFGENNIEVRDYDALAHRGIDIVEEFLRQCDLALSYEPNGRNNVSLSFDQIVFLMKFNERFPLIVDEKINEDRGPIHQVIANVCADGAKFRPARADAMRFYDLFKSGNARVGEKYLGLAPGEMPFDENFDEYPEEAPQLELSEDKLFEFIRAIWKARRLK